MGDPSGQESQRDMGSAVDGGGRRCITQSMIFVDRKHAQRRTARRVLRMWLSLESWEQITERTFFGEEQVQAFDKRSTLRESPGLAED